MRFGFANLKICKIKIQTKKFTIIQKYIKYINIYKKYYNDYYMKDKNSRIELKSEIDI